MTAVTMRGFVAYMIALLIFLPFSAFAYEGAFEAEDPWGVLEFTLEGEAGEWVFVYHELPPDTREYVWEMYYTFEAVHDDGDVVHALFGRPLPFVVEGDDVHWWGAPTIYRDEGRVAYDWHWEDPVYQGATLREGMSVPAITMMLGADAPWVFDVRIVWDLAGPVVAPDQVVWGEGVQFGSNHGTEGPVAPTLLQERLDFRTETEGWTHFDVQWRDTWPLMGRAEVTFANGEGRWMTGADGQSTTRTGSFGVVDNVPGPNRATVSYSALGFDVEMKAAHLTADPDDFPELLKQVSLYS